MKHASESFMYSLAYLLLTPAHPLSPFVVSTPVLSQISIFEMGENLVSTVEHCCKDCVRHFPLLPNFSPPKMMDTKENVFGSSNVKDSECAYCLSWHREPRRAGAKNEAD